jgi:signal peptidase I
METKVYHGCGHIWTRAVVLYGDHYEFLEGWMYVPDLHYPETYTHFMHMADCEPRTYH